jgi:DNA-damage-inducible protein J
LHHNVKNRVEAFCVSIGMSMNTAVNFFFRAMLRTNKLPFEVSPAIDPFPSEANQAHLKKVWANLKCGKGIVHELLEDGDE